jgi:hypothetical protein
LRDSGRDTARRSGNNHGKGHPQCPHHAPPSRCPASRSPFHKTALPGEMPQQFTASAVDPAQRKGARVGGRRGDELSCESVSTV